jgi:hypothetical protein
LGAGVHVVSEDQADPDLVAGTSGFTKSRRSVHQVVLAWRAAPRHAARVGFNAAYSLFGLFVLVGLLLLYYLM